MSSSRYFSRARLRSPRLPWSRAELHHGLGDAQRVVRADEGDRRRPGAGRCRACCASCPVPPPTQSCSRVSVSPSKSRSGRGRWPAHRRVVVRRGEGDLELPRQVGGCRRAAPPPPVRRPASRRRARSRDRRVVRGSSASDSRRGLGVQAAWTASRRGAGGAHDVAHHVAAGGHGGEQRLVDRRRWSA